MSTYQFRVMDTDEIVELDLTWEERHERVDMLRRIVLDDGREAELVVTPTELSPRQSSAGTHWHNGLDSQNLSVRAHQAGRFNQFAKDFDLRGVRWDSTGKCHFDSRLARKKAMRALGVFDNNGGYGD